MRGRTKRRVGIEEVELDIEALGHLGDGRGRHGNAHIHVPLALPGERWQVRIEGRSGRDIRATPLQALRTVERATPICRHFGQCGGCALQHLPEGDYRMLKRRRIETALAHQKLVPGEILPMAVSPPSSRRRVRLAFDGQGQLGFRARGGRRVVAIEHCPIATAEIEAVLPALNIFTRKLGKPGEATITAAKNGLDVGILSPTRPSPALLDAFANSCDCVRLTYVEAVGDHPETLFERTRPCIDLAGVSVGLPPSAFLQATQSGEAALQSFVIERLGQARKVADFFAGLGTFALAATAAGHRVDAFDSAAPAIAALRATGKIARAEVCDLYKDLPSTKALSRFDAAILDPPRAGAEQLARQIAASDLAQLLYVSCEPKSFARDTAILTQAGFRLESLMPVDQFLFSAEIELAAHLMRS